MTTNAEHGGPAATTNPTRAATAGTSKWVVFAIATSGVFMTTLDMGVVNVALPTLTQAFGVPITISQWVILAYVLCITGLLLPMGRLADIVGRKPIFLGGFLVFTLASLLCGLAPSLWLLVAARIVQGIGGAMMQANSAALVTQAFPPEQRGRALGLNGAVVSAGLLSGPVVGGLMIQWLDWQWVFFVNLPIGLVATAVGLRLLPASARRPDQRFDLPGALLFPGLVVSLLLALNRFGTAGLTAGTAGLALLTAGLGAAFAMVERRAAQPMLEFTLFRNQGFRAATSAAFCSFLGISSSQLLMPFYLTLVKHLPPAQIGLVLVTIPASLLILGPVAGMLSDRFGSRGMASAGLIVTATGLLSLATLGADTPVPLIVARLLLLALGTGLFNSPNSSALFGSLTRDRYGVAGAYQSLTRNLGQSIGQTLAAGLWTAVVLAASGVVDTDTAPVPALLAGFSVTFVAAAAIVLVGATVSFFARPATVPAARQQTPATGRAR
ncbi:MAG: MFS transporter [Chloroflexi bacterium]|nr:MFS transporter [Chloroflexota bacterium]